MKTMQIIQKIQTKKGKEEVKGKKKNREMQVSVVGQAH